MLSRLGHERHRRCSLLLFAILSCARISSADDGEPVSATQLFEEERVALGHGDYLTAYVNRVAWGLGGTAFAGGIALLVFGSGSDSELQWVGIAIAPNRLGIVHQQRF